MGIDHEFFRNKFKEFLSNEDVGVFAWHNGVVIGHLWAIICTKENCRVNVYFPLKKNDALFHYGNVKPEYRGNNILAAMISEITRYLFSNQVSRIYGDPEIDNIASQKSFEKMGYIKGGKMKYAQYKKRLLWIRKLH